MDYLRGRGFDIIPIDHADEMHYANNFLTVAPRHIMAVGGQSEDFQRRLSEAGVTVEWIPLENLIDGYGAAHCMTQVLQRAPYQQSSTGVRALGETSSAAAGTYTLQGTLANDSTHGVVIENRQNVLRK